MSISTKLSALTTETYGKALFIRSVEEKFLELFSTGKLNGTVHTCVGQEFSALAFAGQMEKNDYVISNHRCHGHYLAFTEDYRGLIAELMGKRSGICGGIGSSQHLCTGKFFSNGIQGGMVPVSAGLALAVKLSAEDKIVAVFIGDGTLGEGAVYETMNICSKMDLPLLFICENNHYAQTTPIEKNLAGSILKRAEAFGITVKSGSTASPEELFRLAKDSIKFVRTSQKPLFFLVDTYRLNSHSKGDDFRDSVEIDLMKEADPLNRFALEQPDKYRSLAESINRQIDSIVSELDGHPQLSIGEYLGNAAMKEKREWRPLERIDRKQVELINDFFHSVMEKNEKVVFIGEDVLSPYGGAFKVAKGLSEKFPGQVITTPISEAAIAGISNGLALGGYRPFLEIMFGDFITLCMDQIVNHASKFYHMYNRQVVCPVVIRTPMGGGRGYGPTHSQTLDKWIVGIDNVSTVALNILVNPMLLYRAIYENENNPVIVIENKLDYGRKLNLELPDGYIGEQSNDTFPVVRIRPVKSCPTATIVTYGGMVKTAVECLEEIFYELDLKPELLVLSRLCPLDCDLIVESVRNTGKLYVLEEGSAYAGIGSEIIAAVKDMTDDRFISRRIASYPVPVPSCRPLEQDVLVGRERVISTIRDSVYHG